MKKSRRCFVIALAIILAAAAIPAFAAEPMTILGVWEAPEADGIKMYL